MIPLGHLKLKKKTNNNVELMGMRAHWPYFIQESPWHKIRFLAHLAIGMVLLFN